MKTPFPSRTRLVPKVKAQNEGQIPTTRLPAVNRLTLFIAVGWLFFSLQANPAGAAAGESAENRFFEANLAYKNERFQAAADGYLDLIARGRVNGTVYYNLGNAYLRLGMIGRAILFYERARLLTPRDDDLLFNLAHAKSRTRDAVSDRHAMTEAGRLQLLSRNHPLAEFCQVECRVLREDRGGVYDLSDCFVFVSAGQVPDNAAGVEVRHRSNPPIISTEYIKDFLLYAPEDSRSTREYPPPFCR